MRITEVTVSVTFEETRQPGLRVPPHPSCPHREGMTVTAYRNHVADSSGSCLVAQNQRRCLLMSLTQYSFFQPEFVSEAPHPRG